MGSVLTSLGEWIHSSLVRPGTRGVERGAPPAAPGVSLEVEVEHGSFPRVSKHLEAKALKRLSSKYLP